MMDTYLSMIKVILILCGMLAGIYLLSRYAGRLNLRLKPKDSAAYGLKKVDSVYLGYKKFISVVEVKDHVLVIGAGEKEISLLARWRKTGGGS